MKNRVLMKNREQRTKNVKTFQKISRLLVLKFGNMIGREQENVLVYKVTRKETSDSFYTYSV